MLDLRLLEVRIDIELARRTSAISFCPDDTRSPTCTERLPTIPS